MLGFLKLEFVNYKVYMMVFDFAPFASLGSPSVKFITASLLMCVMSSFLEVKETDICYITGNRLAPYILEGKVLKTTNLLNLTRHYME